ncbi:hypothetical protein CVT25_013256 [Psilocybe cyanescens]|uniref:Uncharacterized protein n=1 Tax=Psilocybe cyanescens TaxID=93625 RepID=A0A409VWT8_PSICY|nr:hypothetical protein CVT25_013256 [Psilocybe cyanescens]
MVRKSEERVASSNLTSGSAVPVPQKIEDGAAWGEASCQKICQMRWGGNSMWGKTTDFFEFISQREPAAENHEPGELVPPCKASEEGHGSSLAEPSENDTVGFDTIADLLSDQFVDHIR